MLLLAETHKIPFLLNISLVLLAFLFMLIARKKVIGTVYNFSSFYLSVSLTLLCLAMGHFSITSTIGLALISFSISRTPAMKLPFLAGLAITVLGNINF